MTALEFLITRYFESFPALPDILKLKKPSEIEYGDLLMSREWKFKRFTILCRDRFNCLNCGVNSPSNHVHHKYYLKNKLPWDIQDKALETLCHSCHTKKHLNKTIPIYEITGWNRNRIVYKQIYCDRCGNTGYLPQFAHVQNGICFKCKGNYLDKNVFYSILNNIHNDLIHYDLIQINESYRDFLSKITLSGFIKNIPIHYFVNATNDKNSSMLILSDDEEEDDCENDEDGFNDDDDLPF